MKTLVCPHCGCSLVRLGISTDKAVAYRHGDMEYHFCCQACVDVFVTDPEPDLRRTNDLIVCPTCLAEKKPVSTFTFEHMGQEIHYCGCPYCQEEFQKKPDYYTDRLEGRVPFETELLHG